jgi:teichoic acid transport system permease protein
VSSTRSRTADGLLEIGIAAPPVEYLRRIWARRDFIWAVPLGQLRAQTQSTLLGAGWHLLNPLLTAGLYYLVFGVLFGGRGRVENYPAFLVVGMFTFLFTNRAVQAGATSVTTNMGLITQINFPRLALPLAATVAETISHSLALVALVAMVPILGSGIELSWLLVVPIVALQALFNLGLAMITARLAFQYRDVQNLLPHLLRFWMYFSGLFFTVEFVIDAAGDDSPLIPVFEANPGYIFMTLMRDALLREHHAAWWMWPAVIGWTALMVSGGFVFFRGREVEYGRG